MEYLLNGNCIINLKNLITNIYNFLFCKECAQERDLQIKSEEVKEQENSVAYVEDYFQITPPDEQKGVREIHEDFNKQTYNCQKTFHQDSFCISIS